MTPKKEILEAKKYCCYKNTKFIQIETNKTNQERAAAESRALQEQQEKQLQQQQPQEVEEVFTEPKVPDQSKKSKSNYV